MTPIVLNERDLLVLSPGGSRPAARAYETTKDQASAQVSVGFTTDTWVFFAIPHTDWAAANHWGLGFGPVGTDVPSWSLFRCVTEERFVSRVACPHAFPLDRALLRWTTSAVGPATATLLLETVGSCVEFYYRYFTERPELRCELGR